LHLIGVGIAGTLLLQTPIAAALVGADTCAAATLSSDSLATPLTVTDTTVGQGDNIDIAQGSVACTEAPQCNGQNVGHNPIAGGQSFQGTGIGPDRVFRFRVDSPCTLSLSMLANTSDLNLMFSRGGCGNLASDCSCIDDSHPGGQAETLTDIVVTPNVNYYIIVDGYNGVSDAFSLTITRTAGTCNFTNEICGNNSVAAGEVCDDGNTNDCDGCRGDCSGFETGCGDGFTCGAEVCDDGDVVNCDGCRGDCSAEETGCGDGFQCGVEVCDDSNADSCDGCNGDCSVVETGCGDGVICPGEDCDDDNTTSGDGCSSLCAVEPSTTDAGHDGGNMSLLDGSAPANDAAAAGGNSGDEPDASSGAGAGGNDGGTGEGNGGDGAGGSGGDRAIGGFGNLNPGGAGSSGMSPAVEEKDSGCGCVVVGQPSSTNIGLTLVGMLALIAFGRRTRRKDLRYRAG
jgi:MYXO-CTERM domain-containing protein